VKVGIIGTGVMGSNLAKCLSRKGVNLGYYNRTIDKAKLVAREIGGAVYDDPLKLIAECEAVVVFVPRDEDLLEVASIISRRFSGSKGVFINASTVTPQASLEALKILSDRGVDYVEAPVYGSSSEASECRLVSIVASEKRVYNAVKDLLELYSSRVYYVGEPPSAIVLKLALNNIGLAFPALLAESIMLLEAYSVDYKLLLDVARELWFGQIIERYMERIVSEKPVRFKAMWAMKDYSYISRSLRERGLPSMISDALTSFYAVASVNGYGEKDYPYSANYYISLARKRGSVK